MPPPRNWKRKPSASSAKKALRRTAPSPRRVMKPSARSRSWHRRSGPAYILALGVGSYYDLPAADFFSVQSTFITSGMVQQIHKRSKTISAWTVNREEDASELLSIGVDDLITDKPDMIQQLLREDADLDNSLVLLRDFIRDLFAPSDVDEPTPEEETIEEAIEDPDELLDAS